MIHTVKGFGIVNKPEIDVFLELSCFFHDPADVGNLISGSSAFSKTSLNIWSAEQQVHSAGGSGREDLGVAGRLSGTVSPFRAEQGTSLETPSRASI